MSTIHHTAELSHEELNEILNEHGGWIKEIARLRQENAYLNEEHVCLTEEIYRLMEEVARLRQLLAAALPSIEADAGVMDAMDRHSPLPAADMPSVTAEASRLYRLCEEIRAALCF